MAAASIGKTRCSRRRQYRRQQNHLEESHMLLLPADGRDSNELLNNFDSKVTTINV
jgi:hypothetical protein